MFYRHFAENRLGRDFVIGDLHGMYDTLLQHLDAVGFDRSKDRCFSCGDLIDRGPQSEKCLSLLDEPWFFSVRGNHEVFLLDCVNNVSTALSAQWVLNGGQWHLMVSPERLQSYAEKISRLPLLISVALTNGLQVAICHAQYPLSSWAPDHIQQDSEAVHAMLWSRSRIHTGDDSRISGIDHIFCGHTIVEQPVTLGNTHFIDVGAFLSQRLTVQCLNDLT